jgi:hypothetical protein
MLGLKKKYLGSKIKVDKLSDFFSGEAKYESRAHQDEVPATKKSETMAQTMSLHHGIAYELEKKFHLIRRDHLVMKHIGIGQRT